MSGGIDSTYCFWSYLNQYKDEKDKLLVFHVKLETGRRTSLAASYEMEAVENILKWMDEHNLTNYYYIQSTLLFEDLKPTSLDVSILGSMIGYLLRDLRFRRKLKYVIRTRCMDEINRTSGNLRNINITLNRANKVTKAISDIELINLFPIAHVKKAEMLAQMPKDLSSLCLYCRKPLDNKTPCGECHTCKDANKAFKEVNLYENKPSENSFLLRK